MELLIIITIVTTLLADIYMHLGKKQLEQEMKSLERKIYQTEEYKALVKRLEESKKELGCSQKSKEEE
jgi:predicted GTPase